jgi:peptidoglycan/LPS O-acetylase OafA/YrhL
MPDLLPGPRTYMPQLDALRALAVAAVAWAHWAPRAYQGGVSWGPYGVRLFFVLSGFLITSILLDCREIRNESPGGAWFALRSFYVRRFLRLAPLYYAVILIAALCNVPPVRSTLAWTLTHTTNFYFFQRGSWHGVISHFWSLAVEEQFYLVWPWVIMFVPNRWLKRAVIATVVVSTGLWLLLLVSRLPVKVPVTLPILCCDALGLGSLLALVRSGESRRKLASAALLVGLPCFLVGQRLPRIGVADPILRWLRQEGSLLLFLWLVHRASIGFPGVAGKVLENRILVALGTVSYGLYVIHFFAPDVLSALERLLHLPESITRSLPTRIPLLAAITLGLAWMSWQILEKPIQSWKRHFPYRQKKVELPAARQPPTASQPIAHRTAA